MNNRISIKAALAFLCSLVIVVTLAGIGGAYALLANFKGAINDSANATALLRAHGEADMMHDAFRADYYGAILHSNQAEKSRIDISKRDLAEHKKNWLAANAVIKATNKPADIEKAFLAVEPQVAIYIEKTEKLSELAYTNAKTALASMEEFDKSFEELEKLMGALTDLIEKRNQEVATMSTERAQLSTLIVSVAGLVLIAFVIFASVFVFRIVSQQIRLITVATQDIFSSGEIDLTRRLPVLSGELGQLGNSSNGFVAKLHDIVAEVAAKSASIATASAQISSGSTDLSSRTEEQASTLEETASNMEEFTVSIRQTADNTKTAAQSARGAIENAETGRRIVSEAGKRMTDIHASAKRITEITNIIDSIAFQTNILALNAAVEAARAGEEGRGFAVVASEVRALAQRSASSAKDIKRLIDETTTSIDAGTVLVQNAEGAMDKIVHSNQEVLQAVTEISNAASEQATGVDQVNRAITQLEGVTQQNAALVEESAAASESMRDQAEQLRELMSQFKLSSHFGKAQSAEALLAKQNSLSTQSKSRGVTHSSRPSSKKAQDLHKRFVEANVGPEWEEF